MDSHDPSPPPAAGAGTYPSEEPTAPSAGSDPTDPAPSAPEPPTGEPPTGEPPTGGAGPWNAGGYWPVGPPRLTRVRDGKMVAGVCTGLARATGTDPILFRVILAVLAFFGGMGAFLYLIAWVMLPLDDEPASPVEALVGRGRSSTSPVLTLALVILAGLLLATSVRNGFPNMVLLVACLIGGALLLRRRGDPPEVWPPAAPPSGPFAPYGPYGSYRAGQPASEFGPTPPVPARPPHGRWHRREKERSVLGRLTFSLACLALMVLALLNGAGVPVPFTGYIALALAVVTLGVFAGIWVGRARGLIVLGVLLSLVLASGSVGERVGGTGSRIQVRYGVADQSFTPTSAAQIQPTYHLGIGDFSLDLTSVDFTGVTRVVQITGGVGNIRVQLPPNADVHVDWHNSVGDVMVFDQHQNGMGQKGSVTDYGANGPDSSDLRLSINHAVGDLVVTR